MNDTGTPRATPAGFWQSLAAYAGLDVLRRASFFLLLPIYLAYLAPDALGALVLFNITAALLAVVANLRIDAAMRRFYFDFGDDRAAQDRYLAMLFSVSLMLIAACTLLLLVTGPWLYRTLFADARLQFYPLGLLALGTAFLNTALAPLFVFLRNRRALGTYSAYSVFLIVTNFSMQAVLITQGKLGITGALLGGLLPPAMLLVFVLVTRPRSLLRMPEWSSLRASLRFSIPLVAFSLLYLLESRLDRFFIERFFDLDTVGVYGLLTALLGLCAIALNALDASIRPWLYDALGGPVRRARESVRAFGAFYIGAGLLTLSLITLVGSGLELLTADARYLAVRGWLALGATAFVPLLFTRFWALLYVFEKRTTRLTMWTLLRTAVTLVLLLLLTPRFGIPGALIAILVSQLVNAVIFRLELERIGFTALRDARPLMQALTFIAVVWGTRLALPTDNHVSFGVAQFVLTVATLAVLHRRTPSALRALLAPPAVSAGGGSAAS